MAMKYMVWVHVEKEPTNEVEGCDWEPGSSYLAEVIAEKMVDRDLDTGWKITGVTGVTP